ncbi:MAG: MopE-related protein [Myxococcota bacterium]
MKARRLWAAGLLCAAVSCRLSVDPDEGLFSCAADADCGKSYQCRPQASGGGLCFPVGVCTDEELCNGVDDDCDGLFDEAFPESGQVCDTGSPGVCAQGTRACADAGLVCAASVQPSAEQCDQLDNDCNGQTDETFDLANDSAHCGRCNDACATGAACRTSSCHEEDCADGVDNDGDGLIDCDDLDCLGRTCSASDAGLNCGRTFTDAGIPDGGMGDAGPFDAGAADAGPNDGGETDGGGDGGLDAGQPPLACVPQETVCDDGADGDLDGLTDCADVDCDGKTCADGGTCSARMCP